MLKRLSVGISSVVLRNTFYNLLGLGIPAFVAIYSIPLLIHSLGAEKFGILTIIWAVVGYFGLFDLGLGRALTQHLASAIVEEDPTTINRVIGTGSVAMIALGVLGAAVMCILTPALSRQIALPSNVNEISAAFYWMALSIPAIVMTTCYRGILEAAGHFSTVNAIRVPMGVFTFVAPVIIVNYAGPRLDTVTFVLASGRILACAVHAFFALRAIPGTTRHGIFEKQLLPTLLKTGGWLAISNIVSPLMNYIDRLILGVVASGAAVAFYVTPQELLLRIGIIPGALAAVLFPLFASKAANRNVAQDFAYVRDYSALVAILMAPITLILLIFAREILEIWIGVEFAKTAGPILQVMAAASLISGLAQIPFAMLQGTGRADITAKIHICEFPAYLLLLALFSYFYGPIGAAFAWLIRIIADAALLYFFNAATLRSVNQLNFSLTEIERGRKVSRSDRAC